MKYTSTTKNIKTDLSILNICELFNDFIPLNSIKGNIIFSWPDNVPLSYRWYYNEEHTLTINVSIKVI